MFKRSIARLLVFFQIYGVVFQGVAHANILQHYPVQNEIYLHSSFDEAGGLRLSLGTDSPAKGLETLGVIDVPSYKTLKSQSQKLKIQVVPSDSASSAFSSSEDLLSPVSSAFVPAEGAAEVEEDVDTDDDSIAFTTQDGIVRLPEGVYFDLQGLQIFMNNEGELLIQGAQTDFTKPIFLSSKKSIVLHSVEANVLKLTSPSVVGVGKSSIDFLALEGLMSDEGEEVAATYINTGSLTAKEVFLKNLTSTNTGTLTTDGFEADGGTFRNTGMLEMTAKTHLGMGTFINSGTVVADSINGSATLTSFENTHGGKVIIEEDFRPGESTTVINDGTIEGTHYQFTGPSFIQNGTLTGKSLNVGKDTTFTTGAHQELTLSEHLDSASPARWKLTGTVNVHEFNHLGAIDLEGTLNTSTFTGHGTVQPTGTFTSEHSHFTDAFTNLGQVSTHILDADAALTTNGLMRVSSAADIRGKFKVGAKGRFIGIEDQALSLTCHDASSIAGKVDVDSLSTAKTISVKGRGQLITRQSTTLTDQLTIQPKSVVQFKGLKANGAFIENHGELTVEGIENGAAGLTLTNAGTAHIDAEQVLPMANEGDPENTARIATDIMPAKEKEVAMILAAADPLAKPEVFTRANPIPTSGPAYPPYIKKFKDFLQFTAEGQRFIQEVLGGDVNKMPINMHAFRSDNIIEKYKAWYCENYTIPAAIASSLAELAPGDMARYVIAASPQANPEVFTSVNPSSNFTQSINIPGSLAVVLEIRAKFLAFLNKTPEGQRFLTEEYPQGLPTTRPIFVKNNPIEKYRAWYHENFEIPAEIASSVAEILEQRSELKQRAIEAREAELSLIPSPESHPSKFGESSSIVELRPTHLFLAKKQRFLDFLNRTSEGKKFLEEEFSTGLPYSILDFRFNNPIEKYNIWYRDRYEISAGISSSVIEILEQKGKLQRKAIEAREREAELALIPSPESHPSKFGESSSIVELRPTHLFLAKKQRFLDFLNRTSEGKKFLEEEFSSGLPYSILDFRFNNPIEKYSNWYRERYEIPVEVASSIAAALDKKIAQTQQAIEESEIARLAAPVKKRPIKLNLTNQATGQVTLKAGRFDFVEDTAFANDGTLVQDHAYLHWITGLPGVFNTGTWAVKGSLGLVGYKAEDVGNLEVEETLHVHTTEDALKALGSMSKVKAAKIVMHAPKFTLDDDQQFDMPLELHIQDMFSLQAKLVAPAFVVNARTLELGSAQGKWGVLSAYQNGMKICVDSFRNMFGHVTAMQGAEITVNGDEFVSGAYSQVPGYVAPAEGAFAYPYPRKRNGAAISVGGPLKISVRGQNALLNNYYGLIQSDGYLDLFSQKQLMNFAGIISSKGGGVLSAPEITVQRDAVLRKESGARFCDGHYYHNSNGAQVTDSCSGGGRCSQLYHFREQSDEGWINVGGGDLEIDTNSLSVLASHIISKNNLFLKRQGVEVPKSENGELKGAPGVLVQSHQDSAIYHGMCRNNTTYQLSAIHKAGIFSHSDMELESNGLKIEGISTTKTMDVVRALAQTIQSAGFDVTTDQARDLLIDLTSGAKSQAAEPHSLVVQKDGQFCYDVPFERGVKVGYGRGPMPVLTHSYEAFESNLRPNMFLCPTVSQMVLDQLLDNVVLKALRNPRGSDFAQIMYANAQYAAIKNMKRRLLQNKEAASEEEAEAIVVARYNQLIPITHADMSAYADDMRASAKEMLLFQLGANYRAIEKLKRMEGDLDQEVQELRPQVFIPKDVVSADKTTASVHSDGALNNRVTGDMIMRGAAEYSSHGGTTRVTGNLIAEAVAIRQGSVDNFHEEGAHPLIRNAGTHNTQHILVDGGIALTSARIDTGGAGNVMNMHAKESICEYALPLVDQQTTHSRTKRENIIRIMTRTHMDPLQQIGSGTRTLKSGVVYQQASAIAEDTTLTVEAQQHTHDEVHDQVSVQTLIEKRGKRGWFGTPGSRKTIETLARAYFSQGGKIKGALFSQCDHYKSVNTEYDSANVVINTPQAQFQAGTNSSSSQTRTIYKGAVWNKFKIETESHTTRSPCQFKQPVTVHAPQVRVEQRPGAIAEPNLITDPGVNPTNTKVADVHDYKAVSQRSLAAGPALITKLAVSLVLWSNPVTFGLSGTSGVMANAGFGALCGDMATNMIEQGGDPAKALRAMGRNGTVLNVVKSMATAGLVKELGDAIGVKTGFELGKDGKIIERAFGDYAKAAVLNSAVNTVMSVAIDGQDVGEALKRGAVSAGLNTLANWGAGQIGYLYREEAVNYGVHKVLHGMTGAGLGAGLAVISHQDPRLGAVSGAFGAVLSEVVAEGIAPKTADVKQYQKDRPDQKPEDVRSHFLEKARSTANWAAFASAVGAFGLEMDVTSAHAAARNAVDNNFVHGLFWAFTIATLVEYPQYIRDLKAEEAHVALGKMGIRVAEGTAIGVAGGAVLGKAFEVGGRIVYSLREALSLARASTPVMTTEVAQLFTQFEKHAPQIEKMMVEQSTQLELTHNVGNRAAFDLKLTALQDLAKRGKLVKADASLRDPNIIRAYRRGVANQADKQWGISDPARAQRVKSYMERLDVDHLHELQLGGLDHASALRFLDQSVNRSVGSQLRHQLAKLPDGTKITSVVEKVSK